MQDNSSKFLLVIPTLGHGGAQKILTEIAHHLVESSTMRNVPAVSLLTFKENQDNFYQVNPRVELRSLGTIKGSSTSFFALILAAKKYRKFLRIHQPDVVLSFQDIANFTVLLFSIGNRAKLIVSERQDTRYYSFAGPRKIIRNFLYRFADIIVVQTTVIRNQFPLYLRNRIRVIPNHVENQARKSIPQTPGDDGYFRAIAVGRLVDQKNFTLLIEAAAHLQHHREKWKIEIYGAGSMLDSLVNQIKSLNLEGFVTIYPPTPDIIEKMSDAHLFLFPSKYEGFPNVLAEAVSCGLPAIAFKGVSGNSDLVKNKHNGILLNDTERTPQKFAAGIEHLIKSPLLRKTFGENCSQIVPLFNKDTLLNQWESLITDSKEATIIP